MTQLLFSLSRFDKLFVDALFPPMKKESKILTEWTLVMDALQVGIIYCDTELISETSFLEEKLLSLSLLKHGKIIIDAIEQFAKHLEECKFQNESL